ncbi:MAG: cytochrome c oxidase subunit II [Acidobacteria bacterium]|nr:cytochrome c oxidase subunit II [Acidobacteriota bacterium]
MGSKKGNTGSAATATILALLLVALTVCTVYFFVAKTWWFPPAINEIGKDIDRQFMRTLVTTGVVFVLAQLGLAWAVFRYRARGQRATYSHGNNVMEVIWTLATAIMFIGLGILSWVVDPDDPDGKDDIILGPGSVIAVRVNEPVELLIRSKDVTHSFFVRELRLKQDAVPGMTVPLQFTATVPGEYQVVCAELCGQGHHLMGTFLKVLSREDYAAWLKDMTAE